MANVQVLRFVAAAVVLFGHTYHEAEALDAGLTGSPWGLEWGFGVDIFFVISGFVMMHTSFDRFGAPDVAPRFWRARALRIAPTYWIASLAMIVAIVAFPGRLAYPDLNLPQIVTSFLFIPWEDGAGSIRPVLRQGWTLNYEAFFYAVFGAILLVRRRVVGLSILVAVFVGLVLLHPFVPDTWWPLKAWTDPIIIEFLLGIGVALLLRRGLRFGVAAMVAVSALGVGLWVAVARLDLSDRWLAVPAVVIVFALVAGPQMTSRGRLVAALVLLGDASYVLYLSHTFVINAVLIAWDRVEGPVWGFIAVACIVSIAASAALYLWGERPLLAHLHRRFGAAPRTAPAASEGS